ncbi:hypothetical protein B0J13DRAFT_678972 [Dactylonectria estremocensis]|uniref:Myb-like domain-containing protein n=1 Tax=Dactylonectria estremocensis TaxID=1079267 RepID=A0A9P9IQZ5_9HYPO|nr:hypothetical protein B0J13DRAFT_678972 [Dactylonectria estremocensis]
MSKSTMKKWQQIAIDNGRQPLPEAPGRRPWMATQPASIQSAAPERPFVGRSIPKFSESAKGKNWTSEEVNLLVSLRTHDVGWEEIKRCFPNRPIDGIKQKWFKQGQLARRAASDQRTVNDTKTPTNKTAYSAG